MLPQDRRSLSGAPFALRSAVRFQKRHSLSGAPFALSSSLRSAKFSGPSFGAVQGDDAASEILVLDINPARSKHDFGERGLIGPASNGLG